MMVTYSSDFGCGNHVGVTITSTTVPISACSGDVRTTYPPSPDNPYAR